MISQATTLVSQASPRPNGKAGRSTVAPAAAGADANSELQRSNDIAGGIDRKARFAQTFAQAVGVLMRAPGYRQMRLASLEPLLLPPLLLGNCRIGYGKPPQGGGTTAMALALWARVSPAVDTRLSSNLDKPITLQPSEWSSGDLVWLIAVAGEPAVIPKFVEHLQQNEFQGKTVKMRIAGPAGQAEIKVLGQQ